MARLNFWPCFSAAKKSLPEIRQGELHTMGVFVQALASRGVATALSGALLSTRPVDQLVVSPQLCGSSLWMIPNPRGSLTYRFAVIITAWTDVCQPRRLKKIFAMTSQRLPVLVHDTGEQHAVGGRGVCNGIVTVDDAMDVLTEAAAEDLSIMAAVTPDEKPYFAASAWEHARHRVVWLLILMLSAAITGSIITRYEDAISAVPLLVAFLPMLMDTGGNCGSQSATLVIRGLALEEIRPRDALRVIRKELAVAAIVSAVLAAANGLRIYLQYHDSAIALVISLSLAATVVLAKLVGCMLPIAAKQLHMDPAIMASPLITTIVDAGAVLIYFQAAAALLRLPV